MKIEINPKSLSEKFIMTVDMTGQELRDLHDVIYLIHWLLPAGAKISQDKYALLSQIRKELYYHRVLFTEEETDRGGFGIDPL